MFCAFEYVIANCTIHIQHVKYVQEVLCPIFIVSALIKMKKALSTFCIPKAFVRPFSTFLWNLSPFFLFFFIFPLNLHFITFPPAAISSPHHHRSILHNIYEVPVRLREFHLLKSVIPKSAIMLYNVHVFTITLMCAGERGRGAEAG